MKIKKKNRKFKPSKNSNLILKDCGEIVLENNELVTFVSKKKLNETYDVTKKNWGYYATPSINKRLLKNNFFAYIVQNRETKNFFIMIVNSTKSKSFLKYIKKENLVLIPWPKKLKYQKILK